MANNTRSRILHSWMLCESNRLFDVTPSLRNLDAPGFSNWQRWRPSNRKAWQIIWGQDSFIVALRYCIFPNEWINLFKLSPNYLRSSCLFLQLIPWLWQKWSPAASTKYGATTYRQTLPLSEVMTDRPAPLVRKVVLACFFSSLSMGQLIARRFDWACTEQLIASVFEFEIRRPLPWKCRWMDYWHWLTLKSRKQPAISTPSHYYLQYVLYHDFGSERCQEVTNGIGKVVLYNFTSFRASRFCCCSNC